jgi:nucleoside-diphosphate-sugar epimerase
MVGGVGSSALVTGPSGFIGSHLVRRLVLEGWDVHLVVRPSSSLELIDDLLGRVSLHRYDGSTASLMEIAAESRPDVVFHLASLFLAQHRPEDVEPLITSNVLFGAQLLEAMTANGIHRLVNTGTSWQHFENRDFDPVNLYSATKQAFEALLHYYLQTTPLRAITLKLYDTYGPGDPRPKLFTLLRKASLEQQSLAMSKGEQLIDLVFIDDVIRAFTVAAGQLTAAVAGEHKAYAVSSGSPLPLRELVERYGRITGRPMRVEWGGRPYRMREVMVPWNCGESLPGWRPQVTLEQGVQEMERQLSSQTEQIKKPR